jgi:glycosyltransferase involved in cell wall biosynthesis
MLAIGVSPEKIVVLPFGIDLRRFHPPHGPAERARVRAQLGISRGAVAVGSFQKDGEGWGDGMAPKWVKGPDVLADVLSSLARHFPVHAVIPGPARGYLRHRLAAAGVPYSSPGFVSSQDLPAYYRALDVYVSPSRDEAGPMGVLESMASAVPVIATRTGMAVDLIEHGVNGFLVDVEDARRLVEAAALVIQAPDVRNRVADNGLQTIQKYDWPHLARRYADELYRPAWRVPY